MHSIGCTLAESVVRRCAGGSLRCVTGSVLQPLDHLQPLDQPPGTLAVWVVFERPPWHPGGYGVQPAFAGRGGAVDSAFAWTAPTLEGIRAALPPGLARLDRAPTDHPSIVEVWI
jgi:hypothetical protein